MRKVILWLACVFALGAIAMGDVQAQTPGALPAASRDSPTTQRLSLHWEDVPLAEAVDRLAQALQQPIFVDRRVDPQQRVSLSVSDMPASDVPAALAAATSLGASRLEAVVYLGPAETAAELRTLAALRKAEVRRLPTAERNALLERKERTWPRLAEPRAIVTGLLSEPGWSIHHTERIGHDLWPAGKLPAMPLTDQLTLLLAGFDLTFRPLAGQQAIEIVPIGGPTKLRKSYRWSAGDRPGLEELRRELPDVEFELRGNRLSVVARQEAHERFLELTGRRPAPAERAAGTRPTGQGTQQRFTLRVDQLPVEAVLRQLGQQLGWSLEIDREAIQRAGGSLDQRVSFAVNDATIDQLLDALLAPAGLDYRLEGKELTIVPRAISD